MICGTPLASITGAASSIADSEHTLPPETIRELGRSIQQEADRLSRLVANLLDITHLESGTVRLRPEPYYIEEIIGSALTHLEKLLAKHTITTRAEPDLPMASTDGVLIEQVITNLLENAVKYTPSGSTITITAARKDAMILVSINDNGFGIPAGDEEKIFEKFYTTAHRLGAKGSGPGPCNLQSHSGSSWR